MERPLENAIEVAKQAIYQAEFDKLTEIFKDVEPQKRQLVEGLINRAAFYESENYELHQQIKKTGAMLTSPNNPLRQKQNPALKECRQNDNTYAMIIGKLNAVLSKNAIDEDDESMEEFK